MTATLVLPLIILTQKGHDLTADTLDILTDPEGKQPSKREKQKQEKGYKKEKE